MKKTSETSVVNACLDLLRLKRIKAWRNNVGAMKVGKRFVRFGEAGSPDILGILPGGRALCVECKFGHNDTTETQDTWLDEARVAGALVAVVWDVQELDSILERNGI